MLVIKAWGKSQDSLLISTAFSIVQTADFYVKSIEFLRYSMLFSAIFFASFSSQAGYRETEPANLHRIGAIYIAASLTHKCE